MRGIHVDVLLVGNQFLINIVGIHFLRPVSHSQLRNVGPLKVLAILVQNTSSIVTENLHLAKVAFRGQMALEAVGITALLFTHLTEKL